MKKDLKIQKGLRFLQRVKNPKDLKNLIIGEELGQAELIFCSGIRKHSTITLSLSLCNKIA